MYLRLLAVVLQSVLQLQQWQQRQWCDLVHVQVAEYEAEVDFLEAVVAVSEHEDVNIAWSTSSCLGDAPTELAACNNTYRSNSQDSQCGR